MKIKRVQVVEIFNVPILSLAALICALLEDIWKAKILKYKSMWERLC